jgi:hypothetical protein
MIKNTLASFDEDDYINNTNASESELARAANRKVC